MNCFRARDTADDAEWKVPEPVRRLWHWEGFTNPRQVTFPTNAAAFLQATCLLQHEPLDFVQIRDFIWYWSYLSVTLVHWFKIPRADATRQAIHLWVRGGLQPFEEGTSVSQLLKAPDPMRLTAKVLERFSAVLPFTLANAQHVLCNNPVPDFVYESVLEPIPPPVEGSFNQ